MIKLVSFQSDLCVSYEKKKEEWGDITLKLAVSAVRGMVVMGSVTDMAIKQFHFISNYVSLFYSSFCEGFAGKFVLTVLSPFSHQPNVKIVPVLELRRCLD